MDGAEGPDATSGRLLFEVDEVFKGRVHERQWVDTGDEISTCSISFAKGEPYVVIARGDYGDGGAGAEDDEVEGGDLRTDFCLHSTALELGLPVGLDAPTDPLPGTSPAPASETPGWVLLAGVAALVAMVAAGLAGAGRWRRTIRPPGG